MLSDVQMLFNNKALLIGKLFDLLLTEKNFETVKSVNVYNTEKERTHTILLFSTPYVGHSSWIKITLPYFIDVKDDLLQVVCIVESQINNYVDATHEIKFGHFVDVIEAMQPMK